MTGRRSIRLGDGVVDESATAGLRGARLRAKSDGTLSGAVISAGYYAKKRNTTMFVYKGNSYMHSVYRVTANVGDALDPINNTGRRFLSVSPSLVVQWHETTPANNPTKDDSLIGTLGPNLTHALHGAVDYVVQQELKSGARKSVGGHEMQRLYRSMFRRKDSRYGSEYIYNSAALGQRFVVSRFVANDDWRLYMHPTPSVTKRKRGAKPNNPHGEHVHCPNDLDANGCRMLQHVYESALKRGFSKSRAAQQAWGALENAGYRKVKGRWKAPPSNNPKAKLMR